MPYGTITDYPRIPFKNIFLMRLLIAVALIGSALISRGQTSSKDFYIQALLRTNKGQYKEAIKFFNRAIELKADYAEAFLSRGNALFKMGKAERAVWDYDRAIELNPKFIKAYNHRAYCYIEMKDFRRAIEDFTHVIKNMPDYADVYVSRGQIHRWKNRHDKAMTDFSQAISLDPKSHLAMYERSMTHLGKKDTVAALTDVNNAIVLSENNSDYLVLRASILHHNKLIKEAKKDNALALKNDGNHVDALIQKAKWIILDGKPSKACKTLDKAKAIGSEEAEKILAEHCAQNEKKKKDH